MKKLLLFLFTISFALSIYAQEPEQVNNVKCSSCPPATMECGAFASDNTSNTYVYCYLMFRLNNSAYLDFGSAEYDIKDADGGKIKFKYPITLLNYVSARGWELADIVQTVRGSDGSTSTTTRYLMRKKVSNLTPGELSFYENNVKM